MTDPQGEVFLHKEMKARQELSLTLIDPFRDDRAVGVACMQSWYHRLGVSTAPW